MSFLSSLLRYINYKLNAVDAHSLQPPFIFNFYTEIVKGEKINDAAVGEIELLRERLRRSPDYIMVEDLGAGSRVTSCPKRKISGIAKGSLSSRKFSAFLYRLIRSFDLRHIVELGTSLGINTLYMASANALCRVTTFEGCSQTAAVARQNFSALGKTNILLMEGNINEKLPEYLSREAAPDLVYFDANHQYEATLQYFNDCIKHSKPESVFVFDDIHWSSGMEKAWEEIQRHPRVTLSIDLYDAGIVFFRAGLQKKQYVLEF